MQILSQKDSRWAGQKMGSSNLTVGGYGCLITCLSMLSDWYGKFEDPGWMAKNLSFTSAGLLLWPSITSSVLPMKFVWRGYAEDDAKIKVLLFSADASCVLQVPLVLNGMTYTHWVVLIGYSKIDGYKIADPYYGDTVYLLKRYAKITGYAELTRK